MAGTARPSTLGLFEWSAESSFADTGTDTTATRMIVRDDSIDVSGLARPLVDRGGVFQYLDDGEPNILGPFGTDGTFSLTFDLAGHGTTAAGALNQSYLHKLLAHVFGGGDATDNGGTQNTTAANAYTLTLDGGSEDFTPGGLLRVGALGDGNCEGQCAAIDTVTGGPPNTSATLLTELPAAPADNSVVYAMQHIWPRVDPAGSIITSSGAAFNNTLRVRLATANHQYLCRGVCATSASITGLSAGEIPQVQVTFKPAAWEPVAGTFPGTSVATEHYAAPVAAGSLYVQDRGTRDRSVDVARSFEFSVGFGVQPIMGSGGASAGQNLVGYRRTTARSSISFVVEAEAATTTPTWWSYHSTDANALTLKHVLYTCNPHDGRAIGLYLPRCRPSSSVPTQAAADGLNYVTVTLEPLAIDDTTVSSTIENAPWVLSMG